MTTSKSEDDLRGNKFSYGDAVIIKQNAPPSLHPGEFGSVCSVDQVTSEQEADRLKCQVGEWVYTVEFGNGSDMQIMECYLDKDLGIIHGRELSKYSKYFVDGVVSDIKISVDYIEIKIKSAPIHQTKSGDILIRSDGCFSGKLILPQIKEVVIHNSSLPRGYQEKGTVLAFEVSDHLLNLLMKWGPTRTTSFNIKSGQIWWEQR